MCANIVYQPLLLKGLRWGCTCSCISSVVLLPSLILLFPFFILFFHFLLSLPLVLSFFSSLSLPLLRTVSEQKPTSCLLKEILRICFRDKVSKPFYIAVTFYLESELDHPFHSLLYVCLFCQVCDKMHTVCTCMYYVSWLRIMNL